LATRYHQRWEVEAVFDELKTYLQQRRRVLRCRTPEGVRQEFYGWVLAHYAVCWLMYQAAADAYRELRRQQHAIKLSGAEYARVPLSAVENACNAARSLWARVLGTSA